MFRIIILETYIKEDGIYVRLFPFHIKLKYYPWKEISEYAVREYSPIAEFGGWGMRGYENNRALNISGNKGLQLVFKNHKRLLIGTNKSEELISVLQQIDRMKNL